MSESARIPYVKRLCVFYKKADEFLGKKIEWIVCQKCQRKLRQGKQVSPCRLSEPKFETRNDYGF